jgi:hypothetical protein
VVESDKLAAAELGDGDGEDNARRRRREKLKELLEKIDVREQCFSLVYLVFFIFKKGCILGRTIGYSFSV